MGAWFSRRSSACPIIRHHRSSGRHSFRCSWNENNTFDGLLVRANRIAASELRCRWLGVVAWSRDKSRHSARTNSASSLHNPSRFACPAAATPRRALLRRSHSTLQFPAATLFAVAYRLSWQVADVHVKNSSVVGGLSADNYHPVGSYQDVWRNREASNCAATVSM
jgi:hypothetical protein